MYGRTKADVWFKTEEDAVAAGFKMAKTHPKTQDASRKSQEEELESGDLGLATDSAPEQSEGGES